MKQRYAGFGAGVLVCLVAVCVCFNACEDADRDDAFRIEPKKVTIDSDTPSVSLTVVGGIPPYLWSVSDDTLGKVAASGETATYTRTGQNGANTVRVKDSQTWEASAIIQQMDKAAKLAISPASATLNNNGDKAVFTLSGGQPRYTWTVADASRGTVSGDSSSAMYTRLTVGENTLILRDGSGQTATAKISQPTIPSLAMSPPGGTVAAVGGALILKAVGGTGAYTWGFAVGAPNGDLSHTTGPQTVYASTGAGSDYVELKDGLSSVIVEIKKQ